MLAEPESIELAVGRQDHAVVTTSSDLLDIGLAAQGMLPLTCSICSTKTFFVSWKLKLSGLQHIGLRGIAALSVLTAAPGEEQMFVGDCKGVIASSAYLGHAMSCKVRDLLGLLDVLEMTLAQLAFVIGLSTASPTEDSAHLVQGDGVEISAVDLYDSCLHLDELLNRLGIAASLSFFVEAATPGVNYAILGECKSMIISTSNLDDEWLQIWYPGES